VVTGETTVLSTALGSAPDVFRGDLELSTELPFGRDETKGILVSVVWEMSEFPSLSAMLFSSIL
jgi:hypothetical protein